jgi:hypothetical protein
VTESSAPQGFPAPGPELPLPVFAAAAAGLPPHYYSDPLVTAPGLRLTGWWMRLRMTLRQVGRPLLIIAGLAAVPSVVLSFYQATQSPHSGVSIAPGRVLLGGALMSVVLSFVAGAIGLGASTWLVVRRAAGQPAGLGGALSHGLRRAAPMLGWEFLYYAGGTLGVMLLFGLSQCIGAVGVLLALPVALIGFLAFMVFGALIQTIVAVRGSDNPIRMSWGLVSANFGVASGRILLTFLIGAAPSVVIVAVGTITTELAHAGFAGTVAVTLLAAASNVWKGMILPVGMLLTYAELRARAMPMLASDILDAMEPRPLDWATRDWSTWSQTRPPLPSRSPAPGE